MTIRKFKIHDKFHSWKLNEVVFGDLNLLVGTSGVGKTRILDAILSVRSAGIKGTRRVNGCAWEMEILVDEDLYCWSAEVSLIKSEQLLLFDVIGDDNNTPDEESPVFLRETITKNNNIELVKRTSSKFMFGQDKLPRLKNTESAISLLRDEDSISVLYRALSRFIFSEASYFGQRFLAFDHSLIDGIRNKYSTLDALREATGVPMLIKAYILQHDYPSEFQKIKEDYIEIFNTVSDLKLEKLSELAPSAIVDAPPFAEWLALGIKESGVEGWIVSPQISAGMLRTLIHLIEIALAPSGTVVVVDEFENSLGVNCLPNITDHFLRRSDLQFILTSHHPYVINKIPYRYWKLVSRIASTVSVTNAMDIPAINAKSSHDKFMLLLNSKEYQEGVR